MAWILTPAPAVISVPTHRIQAKTRTVSLPSPSSSQLSSQHVSYPSISIICFAVDVYYLPCVGVAAISAFACYVRTRRRRSLVIGMRERGRQLSEQRQLEADLTSSAGFLPPYIAALPRNIHSKTPALQAHQSRATANDLESGLQNSTHHGVSNEGVRPSVHDPLLRDQGRSRSPSTFPAPAPVPEPTAPPQTYQSAKSPPVCSRLYLWDMGIYRSL